MPPPPDLSKAEDGDVVVTFSGTPTAWFLATGGLLANTNQIPAYSHAEILLRKPGGEWDLVGIVSGKIQQRAIKKALPSFQRLAIFRIKTPPHAGEKPAKLARKWLKDPEIKHASFDYRMEDIPGVHNRFYCLGLINELYRESNLPPPFLPPQTPLISPAFNHLAEIFDTRPENTPLAGSIFQNPAYKLVLVWENPMIPPEKKWLNRSIAQISEGFYSDGWRIKPRETWSSSVMLEVADLWMDLPGGVEDGLALKMGISAYLESVRGAWYRMKRRGQLNGLSPAQRLDLLSVICEKYRDEYFEKVETVQ